MSESVAAPEPPELSVVVPARNEAGNISPLAGEIDAALSGRLAYEIVIVDDGSDDGTGQEADALAEEHAHIRALHHVHCCGQSQATVTGVHAARGSWIATLDGDGQNIPADILKLLDARAAAGADAPCTLFIGRRTARRDSAVRRLASRFANAVRGLILGDRTPDSGCGLKLIRRDLLLDLPRFDALHRFMPALVIRAGGRVISVPVGHRPRTKGASKYGIWRRGAIGLIDMLGVAWLKARQTPPNVRAHARKDTSRR